MKRALPFIIVTIVGLGAVGGGATLYRTKKNVAALVISNSDNERSSGHVRGNAKAPVTLEEFGDYQCPPCGKLAGPLKQLEEQYGDQLCMVFRHYPLTNHAHAREAAQAAEAAGRQGKFWEMHDQLYREQLVWVKSDDVRAMFTAYAALLGMDAERFKHDMDSEPVKERVETDQREATKLGVTATPTIFVNNHAISLATEDPMKPLREAIDAALKPSPSS